MEAIISIDTTEIISDRYFVSMLLPEAIRIAEQYRQEEHQTLQQLFQDTPNIASMNVVVVGAGDLWYHKLALQYAHRYTAVEPNLRFYLRKNEATQKAETNSKITLIEKPFHHLHRHELGGDPVYFIMMFNVFAYLEDKLFHLNRLMNPGDRLYISTWCATKKSRTLRNQYIDHLNLQIGANIIAPDDPQFLTDLNTFPFEKISLYKKLQRIKKNVIDVVTVTC